MVDRTQIPQNYILNTGTLYEDFENVSDWTIAGGTAEADTVNFKSGTQGLKLLKSNPGLSTGATRNITPKVFTDDDFPLEIWVHVTAGVGFGGLAVYLTGSNFAKYFSANLDSSTFHVGWNQIRFTREMFSSTLGENWNTPMSKMRVTLFGANLSDTVATFDKITLGTKNISKFCLTCDDAFISQATKVFPYLSAKGMSATAFINSNSVLGTDAQYMRKADLDTLYAAGWDISNHTTDHTNLTTLTDDADIAAKITGCENKLIEWGYTRNNCHKQFCYPYGAYNDQILSVVASLGISYARAPISGNQYFPIENPLLLNTRDLGLATFAKEKIAIDKAIKQGGSITWCLHKLVASSPDVNSMLETEFYKMVDYIDQRGYKIDCLSSLINGQYGTRQTITNRPVRE